MKTKKFKKLINEHIEDMNTRIEFLENQLGIYINSGNKKADIKIINIVGMLEGFSISLDELKKMKKKLK